MLMAASLAFFACDDDEKKVPETVVTLDRTELNLNVGFSETLVATVTPPLQDGCEGRGRCGHRSCRR